MLFETVVFWYDSSGIFLYTRKIAVMEKISNYVNVYFEKKRKKEDILRVKSWIQFQYLEAVTLTPPVEVV